MNRRQWLVAIIILLLICVTALFPRDNYGRLYPFYARTWQYDPWPHLLCWLALLSAGGLLLWVTSERGKQPSLLRRAIALCGAVSLAIIGFVPPDAHFLFARFVQINSGLWALRLLVVLLMTLCWLWVAEKRSRWGTAQRLVMFIVTGVMVAGPLLFPSRIGFYYADFFEFGFVYLPPALLLVGIMGLADLADSHRKVPEQDT
ncbi:MAG: hypothetical protein BWY76_02696 [bacterium ADurb.Bin429]|nr:MAG: hypothetical protein BWY76_02696 [bacterium ADurb.Bin429]